MTCKVNDRLNLYFTLINRGYDTNDRLKLYFTMIKWDYSSNDRLKSPYTKGKINKYWSHDFAHLIKGCHPLWQTRGMLIPSPHINNSQSLILKIHRPPFLVFLTFFSNKCWWWLPRVFLSWKMHHWVSLALPSKGRLQQLVTLLGTC